MGFPTWTLWGMGLSAFGALLTITLAYIAQSPNLLIRFRSLGPRLARNARTLTGLSVTLLLLGMGFFLAGVPLDASPADLTTTAALTPAPLAQINPSPTADGLALTVQSAGTADTSALPADSPDENAPPQPTSTTPESGAFGLPTNNNDETPTAPAVDTTPPPRPMKPRLAPPPTPPHHPAHPQTPRRPHPLAPPHPLRPPPAPPHPPSPPQKSQRPRP